MNATRKIDLKQLLAMTSVQAAVFSFLFGRKGRNFTVETISEKISSSIIPEDTKKENLEKEKEKANKEIENALKVLLSVGVIENGIGEDKKPVATIFKMPAYNIEDLPAEKQIGIGEKVHTSLTANSGQLFYKGDGVLYMTHSLSPEFKAGIRIAVGELKSFHVNEEGFLYLILAKAQKVDKDGKNLKREQCAVKASKAQLVDQKIPANATECVTYKKAAGLKKPELVALPDVSKGHHVIFFTNVWSPNAKHMGQILEGLKGNTKATISTINTDHQVAECATYNIRTAPTLVIIKDGKETARIENIPAEKPNETILAAIK